jgi:hypothetical protein
MYPPRLPVDLAMQNTPVDSGWCRAVSHGPKTLQEILRAASAAMDAQDEAEAYRRDPVAYFRARRGRRLLDRLLHGRG